MCAMHSAPCDAHRLPDTTVMPWSDTCVGLRRSITRAAPSSPNVPESVSKTTRSRPAPKTMGASSTPASNFDMDCLQFIARSCQRFLSKRKHASRYNRAMRKVKWGVLGAARIALNRVIPGMQAGQWSEVTAIASRAQARAEQAAQDLGIPKVYESYEAMLADPEIEAIYNPLP